MDAHASLSAPDAAVDRSALVAAIHHAKRSGTTPPIAEALCIWSHRRAACVRTAREFDELAAELQRLGAPRALLEDLRTGYRPAGGLRAAACLLAAGLTAGLGASSAVAKVLPAPLVIAGTAMYVVSLALLALILFSRRERVRAARPLVATAEDRLYTIVEDTMRWSEPPPVALDRRALQRARPRERRAGARRAAGERAGTDPGDDPDPEGRPPGQERDA